MAQQQAGEGKPRLYASGNRWSLQLPHLAVIIVLVGVLVLNVGASFFLGYSPLLVAMVVVAIPLIVFLFLQFRWMIPLYILVGVPSVIIPLGSGTLTRLYPGNLLLGLIILIGLALLPQRASGHPWLPFSLMFPLMALVFVGLASIIYSRIQPDLQVSYAFVHSDVSIIVVNITEMGLLLGLPVILVVLPSLISTVRDVMWIMRAYTTIGMAYALGTILAGPLHLYSQEVILGVTRPEVFGAQSSTLGLLLVFFACIALGQAFYTRTQGARYIWWAMTIIFGIAVIMSFGRTAWLALFLSALVMIGFRVKNISVLFVVLLFLLLLLIPGVSDFFNPDKVYGADRLGIWQDAIAIWKNHPYFGVGAGNYQFFDITYGTEVVGVAHNQFLEVLAEMGVQGLLCLVWSILAIGWFTFKRFKAAATSQGKAIALAYIGYYVAIIFSGFFTDSLLPSTAGGGGTGQLILASYHWLLLGIVLTLPQWERSGQSVVEHSAPTRLANKAAPLSLRGQVSR